MILIISQETSEPSTDEVIDWLDYKKLKWTRINGIDLHINLIIKIEKENIELIYKNKSINLNEIKKVWFRRWYTMENLKSIYINPLDNPNLSFTLQINNFLREETFKFNEFIYLILMNKAVNKESLKGLNKSYVLTIAARCGLNVPLTIMGCNPSKSIISKKKKYICKAISEAPSVELDNVNLSGYTKKIPYLNLFENRTGLSLLQEKIIKKYEIRSFFLDGSLYSMAIFSQADKQTRDDFRVYNRNYPNRTCPYKLPLDIEIKLIKLMRLLNLSCGSIDLIKAENDEYVFLEINPEGQFGMTSIPCNYNLNYKISEFLTKWQ